MEEAKRLRDRMRIACDAATSQRIDNLVSLVERAVMERDEAIAHDRQPYPTADAYEKVCTANNEALARAEKAEAELSRLRALPMDWKILMTPPKPLLSDAKIIETWEISSGGFCTQCSEEPCNHDLVNFARAVLELSAGGITATKAVDNRRATGSGQVERSENGRVGAGTLPDKPSSPDGEHGPRNALLTEEEADALATRVLQASSQRTIIEAVQSAAALGARKALEMVRDYHRQGGEIHETWLHKQIRNAGGEE